MSDNDRKLSLHHYDFGEDADVVLPDDPAFDEWIGQVAPAVNVPPSAPRAEMWNEIAARVSKAQAETPVEGVHGIRRFRSSQVFLPLALAATLVMGVAIDRLIQNRQSLGSGQKSGTQVVVSTRNDTTHGIRSTDANAGQGARSAQTGSVPARPQDDSGPARLYRLAAQQTLTQAELLLTAYRTNDAAARDPQSVRQLAQWGRQVLGSTRLLIDSPAGDDPRLKPLLEDLEVVLVQIIQLSGAPLDKSERDLIDGAITSHHLLPRIRSAVPAGTGDAATD